MRSEKSKIKLIVDELLSNAIEADATDIDIKVHRSEDEITIKVVDNGVGMDEEQLQQARRTLKQPYRKDLEEYYGHLAGLESSEGGLNIVGLQVTSAEIESTKGRGTTVIVKRKQV